MEQRVGVVNTVSNAAADFKRVFSEKMPDVRMYNLIDESMVAEIIEFLEPTPYLIARLAQYYQVCERVGCRCILNACSSIADAVGIAEKTVSIPVFQIDRPMAEQAVRLGKRIAIVATAVSTLGPSERTFLRARDETGCGNAQIRTYYCEGAHKAYIMHGDKNTHDRIVAQVVEQAARENDVIALAQGSMASLATQLGYVGKPILTSIDSGVEQIVQYLQTL